MKCDLTNAITEGSTTKKYTTKPGRLMFIRKSPFHKYRKTTNTFQVIYAHVQNIFHTCEHQSLCELLQIYTVGLLGLGLCLYIYKYMYTSHYC